MSATPVTWYGTLFLLPLVALIFIAFATGVVLWIVSIARHGWRTRDTLLLVLPVAMIVAVSWTLLGRVSRTVESGSVEYASAHSGRSVAVQVNRSSGGSATLDVPVPQPINAWPELTDPSWIGTPAMSTEQAVELVARAMIDGITSTKQGRPATMVSSDDDVAFRDQVIARVRVLEPAWTVRATDVEFERMDAKEPLYWVALRVAMPDGWQVAHAAPKPGTVTVHIADGVGRSEQTFAVQNTPWLLDLQDFRQQQRGRQWVVARSSSTCPTEAQARQEMVDDAMRQLDSLPSSSRTTNAHDRAAANTSEAREVLRKLLMDRDVSLVTDQIVQTIERPYGTIYRAAMLIDAEELGKVTPVKLTQAVPTVTTRVDRPMERPQMHSSTLMPARSFFAFLTLALGVLFAGWLVNLVSRGYFQVRILVAAALLATLALMIVGS